MPRRRLIMAIVQPLAAIALMAPFSYALVIFATG